MAKGKAHRRALEGTYPSNKPEPQTDDPRRELLLENVSYVLAEQIQAGVRFQVRNSLSRDTRPCDAGCDDFIERNTKICTITDVIGERPEAVVHERCRDAKLQALGKQETLTPAFPYQVVLNDPIAMIQDDEMEPKGLADIPGISGNPFRHVPPFPTGCIVYVDEPTARRIQEKS